LLEKPADGRRRRGEFLWFSSAVFGLQIALSGASPGIRRLLSAAHHKGCGGMLGRGKRAD